TRANNITSPLATDGKLSIVYKATSGKTAHVVLDVTGYFLADATGATFETVTPARSLDTRDGTGGVPIAPLARATPLEWQVAGENGIPADAAAVTGNLTMVNQTAAGFLSLGPDLPATPSTSTLNVPKGDVRANGVTVKLDGDGRLTVVYTAVAGATTNIAFDVTGYYVNDLTGARFVPMTPGRRLDTRVAAPYEGLTGAFAANIARTLVVTPHQGVPNNATAIAGNLTVVNQTRAGFVAVTDVATNNPTTSSLNFPLGDIRANGVTTPLGPGGSVGLVYKATSGSTHLLLDITGYFR
ncbi:MAG TPA: hypothetical protein VFO73_05980, partial [Candidatus Limnocylindrales bacterium]|nr:hypothetical protein [Candidatus Limnocylindrales bacterium]